tara:strand:+ start:400 stop:621 length:222 start_codon:yes stop_codon:yes gene_type:complete
MFELEIIGWVYIGVIIGFITGYVVAATLSGRQLENLKTENIHLKFIRNSLKAEILRMDSQSKPRPRKYRKRNV